MDVTERGDDVVVDYEGAAYELTVVDDTDDELLATDLGGQDATLPDEVEEELESRGYVVRR